MRGRRGGVDVLVVGAGERIWGLGLVGGEGKRFVGTLGYEFMRGLGLEWRLGLVMLSWCVVEVKIDR